MRLPRRYKYVCLFNRTKSLVYSIAWAGRCSQHITFNCNGTRAINFAQISRQPIVEHTHRSVLRYEERGFSSVRIHLVDMQLPGNLFWSYDLECPPNHRGIFVKYCILIHLPRQLHNQVLAAEWTTAGVISRSNCPLVKVKETLWSKAKTNGVTVNNSTMCVSLLLIL